MESTADNQLHRKYCCSGPVPALILTATIYNLIGIVGILGNLFLCFVTRRNISLRGTSNILLAITAIFEILHQSGHFFFLAIAVSGTNFVPYHLAAYFQFHAIFGISASQMAMLLTALDRLFAVTFPMLHFRIRGKMYVNFMLSICCIVGLYFAVLTIQNSSLNNWSVTGLIGDLIAGEMASIFCQFALMVGLATMLTYVLVWLIVRFRSSNFPGLAERNARVFRSLVAIICITLGGYFLTNFVHIFVIPKFGLDEVQGWFAIVYAGLLLNIGAGASTPFLYIFSKEYERIFLQEAKQIRNWIRKCLRLKVHHQSTQVKPYITELKMITIK